MDSDVISNVGTRYVENIFSNKNHSVMSDKICSSRKRRKVWNEVKASKVIPHTLFNINDWFVSIIMIRLKSCSSEHEVTAKTTTMFKHHSLNKY
jgi:hypothetical protein